MALEFERQTIQQGDRVKVFNPGGVYDTNSDMASRLGIRSDWRSGYLPSEGDTGIVVAIQGSYVAVKSDSRNPSFVIHIDGLRKTEAVFAPKSPTHGVIWDEDDEDPVKLFTSEKDARQFIMELSEKSYVKKDSILLLEIKSCKSVTIRKSLTTKQHKI